MKLPVLALNSVKVFNKIKNQPFPRLIRCDVSLFFPARYQ